MTSRLDFLRVLSAAAAVPAPALPPPAADSAAEAIFRRAKDVWRARRDLPYLAYALRERYVWRDRPHENWWHVWYRSSDRRLALQRIVVSTEEDARLKGSPISLHLRFHQKNGPASMNLDTNPNADAFVVEDPLIEPVGSFGMLRGSDAHLAPSVVADLPSPGPLPTASAPTAAPEPSSTSRAEPHVQATPLRELGRVEAIARDYRIASAGIETLREGDAVHLTLAPLRNPYRYRLRDLWIATTDGRTLQLVTQGLFDGPPYDQARWRIRYVTIDGRTYVQEIATSDGLRFGPDHTCTQFAFDFVGYEFPPSVPESVFVKLLS